MASNDKWETCYTVSQYKQAVKTAFHLGIIEGSDKLDGVAVVTKGSYSLVRLKRKKPSTYKVQVCRRFLPGRQQWINVIQTHDEDCAIAFMDDIVACLDRHAQREDIMIFKKKALTQEK